ncbi:hypothetical protein MMC25_004752 [Agyrium rufum]|nr:hypothetical protein [Agyrium rufum]
MTSSAISDGEVENADSKPTTATFQSVIQRFAYDGPMSSASPIRRITRSTFVHPNTQPPTSLDPGSVIKASPSSSSSPLKRKSPDQVPSPPAPSKKAKTTRKLVPTIKPKPKPSRSSPALSSTAKYASHPNLLTDSVAPNLICLFIGVNPGLRTAAQGHAYAHPSNLFWKLLHSSGCTSRRCSPTEDHSLPELFELGLTNIVERTTRDASELTRREMDAGVPVLAGKIRRWKPEAVALVGKGIWESVFRVLRGRALTKGDFWYGWQDEEWEGARVFVATSTSGLAAGMRPAEKEEVWRGLGEWVCRRRAEREKDGVKVEESVEELPVFVQEIPDEMAENVKQSIEVEL